MTFTISKERLAAIAAKYRASKSPLQETPVSEAVQVISQETLQAQRDSELLQTTDKHGNLITYNSKQQEFITLASSGRSCVLIGAAGTGKTTCQKGATQALIQSGKAGVFQGAHKYLQTGSPGIVICAFTRRAAANIAANLSQELKQNCMTIHALLEYEPVYYDVQDPTTGEYKKTMRFEPRRNASNPLPASIKTIIFEETSMLGTDLHRR